MIAGYGFADSGDGIVELPVVAPGIVSVVVCCTDPSETPGSVGTRELGVDEAESGFKREAELDGSIWRDKLLGAAGSTRFVSVGD